MVELIDKGQKRTMALLAGWAFDYRIFDTLELPYNRIVIDRPDKDFHRHLCEVMDRHAIATVSLLGWSQGAFRACAFAEQYPQRVDELILTGARGRYDPEGLAQVQQHLRANARAYLYQFYKACFSGQHDDYRWFKATLLKDYLAAMDTETLIADLHWLGQTKIDPEALRAVKNITVVHGQHDAIAPIDAAVELSRAIPSCRYIMLDAGHLPFLHPEFSRGLHES